MSGRLVLLLQAPGAGRDARVAALEAHGHRVVAAAAEWVDLRAALDAHAFEALAVDCSERPSHARECAKYLAERKATRDLPLLLVGVKPADHLKTGSKLPSARLVTGEALTAALSELPAAPLRPVAPPPPDPTLTFRKRFDLVGDGWVLVGRSEEFRRALTRALGEAARFQSTTPRGVTAAVVELPLDTPDLPDFFRTWQSRLAADGSLWVISPKREHARRLECPHTWDAVQAAALTTNLVDTKIAAFSENLTATRFVIRKERRGGGKRR